MKFAKIQIVIAKSKYFFSKKCPKNIYFVEYNKLHIFEKPLTQKIQVCKVFGNFSNLNLFVRRTRIVQIPCKGVCAKVFATFLCRYCNLLLFLIGFSKSFNRLKSNIRWSKYRFSLVKVK